MSNSIRLLLADDHTLVRQALNALLAAQPDLRVVGQASDGEEALDQFRLHQPCVTLMDLHMPRMNGIEATERICHEFPHARILFLTIYMEEWEEALALQAGAVACLRKVVPVQELFDAIRTAAACSPTDLQL